MKPAYLVITILKHLKNKQILLWGLVLTVSSIGPLLVTYVFSRGVNALETHQPLNNVLWIFFGVLAISSIETLVRVAAKTRIHYFIEAALIKLQQTLLKNVKVRSVNRKPTIQAIRNLTRSIQLFSTHFIDNGIASMVSFIVVPFILFFLDKRIFWVEMALIVVYLTITFFYSYKFEKQFERYDETREKYFLKMSHSNRVSHRGTAMTKAVEKLQRIRFFEWASVQNIILIFQFIITAIIIIDIVTGTKGISDLVLIIGYTNESKKFLNSITSDLNRIMQVKAGVERVVITSHGAKEGSILSLR